MSAPRCRVFQALLLPLLERLPSAMQVLREQSGPALSDGPGKQALGERRSHQVGNGDGACGLPKNRDAAGVAAESGNVLLHPLEGCNLVQQSIVPGRVMWRFF